MVSGTQPLIDCVADITGVFTTLIGKGKIMVSVQPAWVLATSFGKY